MQGKEVDILKLEYLKYPNYNKEIKKLYTKSFPKNERFPFWILKHSMKKGKGVLQAIIYENNFIGMFYIVNCESSYYLMYLAIKEEYRNKKYGTKVLRDLHNKYGTIFLSVEKPSNEISKRRKKFYLRNNYYETNFYCNEKNVDYEVLCNNKNYIISDEIHKKRYDNMTDSKIVKFLINQIF